MSTSRAALRQRVLTRIKTARPCTSVGMLADDLRLKRATVDRLVRVLINNELIEVAEVATDGYPENYTITAAGLAWLVEREPVRL